MPETVLLLLLAGSALSLGMVGYGAGINGTRSVVSAVVLVVALGAVMTLVIDLDRPQEGFLQVSQQALLDVQALDRDAVTLTRALPLTRVVPGAAGTRLGGAHRYRWSLWPPRGHG